MPIYLCPKTWIHVEEKKENKYEKKSEKKVRHVCVLLLPKPGSKNEKGRNQKMIFKTAEIGPIIRDYSRERYPVAHGSFPCNLRRQPTQEMGHWKTTFLLFSFSFFSEPGCNNVLT